MILSHKIQLLPNKGQTIELLKACGCARFAYNWGLAEWTKQYKEGLKPKAKDIKKKFNKIKGEEFPWIYESPKDANQQPFSNLDTAFQKFFKKTAKYPTFKKKGQRDSFYVSNDKVSLSSKHIKLPLIGQINLSEKLRFDGKIQYVVISRTADKWFASIAVDVGSYSKQRMLNEHIGVDLGLKAFATTSAGKVFIAPKPLADKLKKLARLQRRLNRRTKGSKNRFKTKSKIARIFYTISSIRKDFLNKTTTSLCRENQSIVIEDLNVHGMLKNSRLARSISDMGWYEFRRQLAYKSQIFGTDLIIAPRFYPSSKTCSRCGYIKESLKLSERIFVCESCGASIDRDYNAAANLRTLGPRGINVCGQGKSVRALVEAEIGLCSQTST